VHVQVLIRWALQRGTSCLPKSANPGRIASNFDAMDWQLQPEDQQALDSLPYRVSTVGLTDWHMPAYAYMVEQEEQMVWLPMLVLKPLTATKS
jgi:diketogulonate reductase-like aldo/keto reductase